MTFHSTNGGIPDTPGRPSPEKIEGLLNAHRKILSLMLIHLQRRDDADDLMAALDSLSVMQDHQEDPGAVIGGAQAIEGALAQEVVAVVQGAAPAKDFGGPGT